VLAYTGGDGVALAKVLKEFIKNHPELQFEQAFLEGQILEAKEAEKIAELPSREELITKLVYLLQSPIRRLAVALNAPLQHFANVIGQLAERDEEAQEAQEPQEVQEAEASLETEEPQEAQDAPGAEGSSDAEETEKVEASEESPKAGDDQEAEESQELQAASQENQESKES
jgi:large subunit ribosomal protein L10